MNARENSINLAKEKGYKTDGVRVSDLKFYKKEVNLISFAEYLGYKVNTEKTGRNLSYNYRFVRLDYPDSKNPEDRILVYKNRQDEFCFKGIDGADFHHQGSAIDLVQRRYNCNFGESLRELDTFIQKNGFGSNSMQLTPITMEISDLDKEIKSFNNIKPLNDYGFKYLEQERGLSKETIEHPLFKDQIFSSLRRTSSEDKPLFNIAFPLRGMRSLEYYVQLDDNSFAQAFDVRNKNFKSTENQSLGAFWRSNFDRDKPLDTIFVGESPIDCLAHFELNKDKLSGKNIMYMATAGAVQSSQLHVLQIPYSSENSNVPIKAENLVSIFDNDLAGGKHTAQIIASLNHNSFSNSYSGLLSDKAVTIIPSTKAVNNTASILFVREGNEADNAKFSKNFISAMDRFNANVPYLSGVDSKRFECSEMDNTGSKVFLKVSFHNSSHNFQILNDFMIREKFGNSMRFRQDVPVLKDFNDDLKAIKGLETEKQEKYSKKTESSELYSKLSQRILSGRVAPNDTRLKI